MITVTPENTDQYGRFTIVTREIGPAGIESVHRRPLVPGQWQADPDGAHDRLWVPTDVEDEHPVIRAHAAGIWTDDVVAAYRECCSSPTLTPGPTD